MRRGLVGACVCATAVVAALFGFSAIEAARLARAFPPQGSFVMLERGRLHYTERLPPGPPRAVVVLLHGASGNQADLMVPLGDRLAARGFRVVAVDRPGHGWSDRPDGAADASPARQAVLIRAGLERLGIHHAVVLGHSWAGALAESFALDQADFTEGLVLVSPVTHPWPTGIAWYYPWAASARFGWMFAHTVALPAGLLLLPAGVAEVFAPQAPPPDFVPLTGVSLVLRPSEFAANAQDVAGLLAFVTAQAPREAQIAAPTAIVTGDHDGIVLTPLHALASARAIPRASLTVLRGVGHSPHWSDPDAVVAAVEAVVSRRDGGSALQAGNGDPLLKAANLPKP